MIGTTELLECKEKALGIIADWLWILALIIGIATGVIQGNSGVVEYCISVLEQWEKTDNILHFSLGKKVGILEN